MDITALVMEGADVDYLEELFHLERYLWLALSPDMAAVVTIDGQIEDFNAHWELITGFDRSDLQDSYLIEFIHFDDREKALAGMQKLVTSDIGSTSLFFRFRCSDGSYKRLNWTVIYSPMHSAYFCVVRDATESKAMNQENMAYHDVLTGLENRLAVEERLPRMLAEAKNQDVGLALVFIDLDGFKDVNDTFGHKAGDVLLVRAARRMQEVVGDLGSVYRLGGDEFIIALPRMTSRDKVNAVAEKVIERLNSFFVIDKQRVNIGASLGIAKFPTDAEDAETLLDKADKAMYYVKYGGKNSFAYYSDIKTED